MAENAIESFLRFGFSLIEKSPFKSLAVPAFDSIKKTLANGITSPVF
jgi:hypothetical protein